MVKCPFCQYDNEDGALFCEQCKSDLGTAEPAAVAKPVPPEPFEEVPLAGVVEETVPYAPAETAPAAGASAEPVAEPPLPVHEQAEDVPLAAPVAEAFAGQAAPIAAPAAPAADQQPSTPASGPTPSPAAPAAAPEPAALPPGAQPKLVVLRGLKINVEYPLYEGHNFVGRADEKPVDIDLEDQEPPDRIWSSRQHALITYEDGKLVIEDLNSSNGTFVNRTRIYPGQKRPLNVNDVIQIGTVQMKLRI